MAFPNAWKLALRPSRSPALAWPTRPMLMAASAGVSRVGRHRQEHDEEARPDGECQGAGGHGHDGDTRGEALGAGRIHEGAPRHLPEQAHEAAHRQGEADIGLGPLRLREIHGEERPETGLKVGHEEREGVQTAAAADGHGITRGRSDRPRIRGRVRRRTGGLSGDRFRHRRDARLRVGPEFLPGLLPAFLADRIAVANRAGRR